MPSLIWVRRVPDHRVKEGDAVAVSINRSSSGLLRPRAVRSGSTWAYRPRVFERQQKPSSASRGRWSMLGRKLKMQDMKGLGASKRPLKRPLFHFPAGMALILSDLSP